MITLGLNLIHDSSAAILVDDRIVAAVEEERFNRQRHSTAFPDNAVRYCLEAAGVELADVDEIATSFDFRRFALNFSPSTRNTLDHDDASWAGRIHVACSNFETYVGGSQALRSRFRRKVLQVPHHLSHAYTAYYFGEVPESNVLTIDGRGENEATVLYHGKGARLRTVQSYGIRHSLGHLYSYATHLCGLYSNPGQEGKTMGLASYGRPLAEFSKVVEFNANRYRVNRSEMRKLKRYATELGKITDDSRNVAHAVQKTLDRTAIFLARVLFEETGCRNLALAGGVALNATMNGKLLAEDFVDRLFVFPAANDAGTAIGAALYAVSRRREVTPHRQELVYLGPSFDDDAIERELRQCQLSFERRDDIEEVAADLLSQGKIVGWFQGRMEFGPRALGHRSILADPRSPEMKDRINGRVKHREGWRPFAPAVLYERMEEYFERRYPAPYMIVNFDVREEKRQEIPAVVHVDGTARVQTVTAEGNPRFHKLLSCFAERTGVPILLNTSFNSWGEPIVCTPRDAIGTFFATGLDVLCIGNFLLRKDGGA